MSNFTSNGLDIFCGSPFWDNDLTWNTTDPYFTECFENTVLVWIPCAFLFLFSPVEAYYLLTSKKSNVPWNWFNITKLALTTGLMVLTLVDFLTALNAAPEDTISNAILYSPLIKLLSLAFSGFLVYYNKKHGMQTSGLLFLFWFLMFLCGIPQFRREIDESKTDSVSPESYSTHIVYLIYFPCVIVMFLLNTVADQPALETRYIKTDNPSPEETSSFLSRLFFAWFDIMTWRGFRNPLEQKDLWDMNPEDTSREVIPKFEKIWHKSLQEYASPLPLQTQAKYKSDTDHVNFVHKEKKLANILPAIVKYFGLSFGFGAALKLFHDLLIFVSPQILGLMIKFVADLSAPIWRGYFYAVLLISSASLQTILLAQYYKKLVHVGMQLRSIIMALIYKKALRISNTARKESTAGEIVNLMAVDSQRLMATVGELNNLWSAPLQIILALYFLWRELGPSVLAGMAVMILLIPINSFIAKKMKTLQTKQMKNKDERIKLMNEILGGMKILKLYAWEPSFEKQILRIRKKEVKVLRESAFINAGNAFIYTCASFLVLLVTFATYLLLDENNVLDANKAFVSISLFNILRSPLNVLPMLMSNLIQTWVSIKRINHFMNADELDPNNVQHEPNQECPLTIEHGTFSWGEHPILKDIDVQLNQGTLTAVVGAVGSGKSSLISAFLGEMDKISGKVNSYGSIAYVSQQAWIQNATLKDNILFGSQLNNELYEKVLEACALKPDLEILPGGDLTEIGEKGINLSGGQKQRVSLARAVYANADIYFLDDPLSAVDSHVGKHIFDKVIGPKGILKGKTKVLVTHGITYLPQTDKILVIKDGEVSENGTYRELLDRKGEFAEFLLHHIDENAEAVEDLDVLKDQLTDTPLSSRVPESHSASGPTKNESLPRQKSIESSLDKTKSSMKDIKTEPKKEKKGQKLIGTEKAETGTVSWAVYKHYFKSMGFFLVFVSLGLSIMYQVFGIGSDVWLGIWADDSETYVNGTADTAKRDMYLGVYAALGIGQAIGSLIFNLTVYVICMRAAIVLHQGLLGGVLHSPMAFFDTQPIGRILSRFSKDVQSIDDEFPGFFANGIRCLLQVLGTVAVITYTTPLFAIVIIPISIIYYLLQRFYVATSRQLQRLVSISRSPVYSHFGETITGAQSIRAFSQQNRFILESERKVDLHQACFYPSVISRRWLALRLEMIGNLIIFFAALFCVLSKGPGQSPGLVGLSITYSLQITLVLNLLVRMSSDIESNIVSVERIKEYAETPQEAPWEIPNRNPPKNWPETGAVQFQEYAVRYRPGLDLVLRGINFNIRGGEKVGIVGRTGAGKSSLTLSLFRIIEAASGSISIDGVNISEIGLHRLRSRLTIIPQDSVLFSGSLRMNLDPFDGHNDQEIWEALDNAHLITFVKGLAAGLQHEVTEGGENLSVGQRQLICLARALLRKTKVLILDEATAAIDLETDELIQKTIRTQFRDCTVLTIAHRLNTIMDSDRIIVLDKGEIVEFDSPENLLSNTDSIFSSMHKDAGLS